MMQMGREESVVRTVLMIFPELLMMVMVSVRGAMMTRARSH